MVLQKNNRKRPKVLMVGPGRDVKGGISTVVNNYYRVGLDQEVELKYIVSMEDGSKFRKLRVAFNAYLKFCHILKHYDIVHIHMAAQASFWRKAFFIRKAFKSGRRVIIHQHGGDFKGFFYKQSGKHQKKIIRSVFKMADKIVVLSDEWAKFFTNGICDECKIVILYNSVSIPLYKKNDYTDHKILFLGRLGKAKGCYDLLAAIPKVLKRVPDAFFFLGGDGEIEKSKEIAKKYGVEDRVQILGWINGEKKEKYLRDVSIFVLPSYYEGMPMAVLEAMSYGMATISTNVGGIPQIICDGINGILIEAGDIEALSDALVDLLLDGEKKRRLGQTACGYIQKKFDIEKNIETLYQVYMGLY